MDSCCHTSIRGPTGWEAHLPTLSTTTLVCNQRPGLPGRLGMQGPRGLAAGAHTHILPCDAGSPTPQENDILPSR